MEPQQRPENDANNPDNNLADLVRDRSGLVDRMRDVSHVVRSSLQRLQRVVAQQRLVNNSLDQMAMALNQGPTEAAPSATHPTETIPKVEIDNLLNLSTSSGDIKVVATEVDATEPVVSTMDICELPNELMSKVLKNLPFGMIASNRIVCRHFNLVCSDILNSEFKCLRNVIQQRLQTLKSQMPRRESARRQHPLAREFDIIETVNMRLSLMQTIFSKHIDRAHCSFFAGQVLDEVHRILLYLKTTPVINFAYKVTDELFDLSTMAVEYFKERIEPTLPDINYIAGFNDYCLFDSASSSSGSVNGLDGPGCSKSMESIPQSFSPESEFYSSFASLNSADNLTKTPLNTQEVAKSEVVTQSQSPFSLGLSPVASRRILKLELRNRRAHRTIKSLKTVLRTCKRKMTSNQRQIRQYHSRFEDYDKKLDATCAKLNSVLEELTKCKTEIQHLRSTNTLVASTSSSTATILLTPETDLNEASPQTTDSDDKSPKAAGKRKLDLADPDEQQLLSGRDKQARID